MKPLNWIQWVTLATVIAVVTLMPYIVYQLNSVSDGQSRALRTIICFTEQRVKVSKQLTPVQRRQALQFYEQALKQAHIRSCA